MSAESDFWAAFVYDNDTETWRLAPGLAPLDLLVICSAKILSDLDEIDAVNQDPPPP